MHITSTQGTFVQAIGTVCTEGNVSTRAQHCAHGTVKTNDALVVTCCLNPKGIARRILVVHQEGCNAFIFGNCQKIIGVTLHCCLVREVTWPNVKYASTLVTTSSHLPLAAYTSLNTATLDFALVRDRVTQILSWISGSSFVGLCQHHTTSCMIVNASDPVRPNTISSGATQTTHAG